MNRILKTKNALTLVSTLLLTIAVSAAFAQKDKEDLNVFTDWVQWTNAGNMLQLQINREAFAMLDKRQQEVSKLQTRSDWEAHKKALLDKFRQVVGPLPEKTPLNAKVVSTIRKDGYRVEKIIYESMPGLYVTGALFIPDGKGKKPAVLNVLGHSWQSFRRDAYQDVILNLVKKGFVVFVIDPVSQGERVQYYNEQTKKSDVGIAIVEHSYVGNQCLLSGYSVAKYFIWDGIRGIDYLATRKEVDMNNLGVTGTSGGGTVTTYLGILDDRVKAAAISCYITSFRRILQSIGTQDGEQFLYHSIAAGIDHADLVELRAPKPTLLLSQSRDFFSIQGTRETFTELKKAFEALGAADNINMVEDDFTHSQTTKTKEAIYGFFQKQLNNPGDPAEEKVTYFPEQELNVTETGQLATSRFKSKRVFDANKPEPEAQLARLADARDHDAGFLPRAVAGAKRLSGYRDTRDEELQVIYRGRYKRSGYSVERYAIQVNEVYAIPILLVLPDMRSDKPAVLYLHPQGKIRDAQPGGRIERLVRQGHVVVAPDVLGTGETQSARTYPGGQSYNAQLIGRSIVGIQATDISRVISFLRAHVGPNEISAVAFDESCPSLLHAAAFDERIGRVTLINPLISYGEIATNARYKYDVSFSWGVAGALTAYDLPDLAASISPRPLSILSPLDHAKRLASSEQVSKAYAFAVARYGDAGASRSLVIHSKVDNPFESFLNSH